MHRRTFAAAAVISLVFFPSLPAWAPPPTPGNMPATYLVTVDGADAGSASEIRVVETHGSDGNAVDTLTIKGGGLTPSAPFLQWLASPGAAHPVSVTRIDGSTGVVLDHWDLPQATLRWVEIGALQAGGGDAPTLSISLSSPSATVSHSGSGSATQTRFATLGPSSKGNMTVDHWRVSAGGIAVDFRQLEKIRWVLAAGADSTDVTGASLKASTGTAIDALRSRIGGADVAGDARVDAIAADGTVAGGITLHGAQLATLQESAVTGGWAVEAAMTFASIDFGATSGGSSGSSTHVFGTLYPAGDAGQVGVVSAEWSVERYPIKDQEPIVPTAEQKLLVLHARLRNASGDALELAPGVVHVRVADASGGSTEGTGTVIDEETHAPAHRTIRQNAEAKIAIVTIVPAGAIAKRLEITGPNDERLGIEYDLSDPKNAIAKLQAPFVAPNDSTGEVARERVPARPSVAYPLGDYDLTFVRLDHVASFGGGEPAWIATVRARNRSLTPEPFSGSTFTGHLTFSGSDDVSSTGIYPAGSSTDTLNTTLQPGADAVVRIVFQNGIAGKPTRLWVSESDSRVYDFEKPTAGGG